MRVSLLTLSFASLSAGHGIIVNPPARSAGEAMKSACGVQVTNNLQSNEYGNIQSLSKIGASQSDFDPSSCDVSLCKGERFDDNTDNVQTFTPGQMVAITADIQAKHTGTCNVSVVDTATNKMISNELAYFPVYASTATELPKNNTQFDITMPDVSGQCGTAGDCVVQWWWDSRESDQTYMSCIDFVM